MPFANNNFPRDNASRDNLIRYYFSQFYTAKDVKDILSNIHHIQLSERHLKRIKKGLNLQRAGQYSTIETVVHQIVRLYGEGYVNIGYRFMWKLQNVICGVRVTPETVRIVMTALDPEGVNVRSRNKLRRRHYSSGGPYFIIHIDGYDKLKPFGIAIHGAIDGFSRKVLWLKAGYTNNNPRYIAGLYLDFIKRYHRLPRVILADGGSENVTTKLLQMALCYNHNDRQSGTNSFITGRSTSNQGIERLWGSLSAWCIQFWTHLFRHMRDHGILRETDPVHIESLRFCFMPLIQKQLDDFVHIWNLHRIRSQCNTETFSGISNIMFYQPETFGAHSSLSVMLPYSIETIERVSNDLILRYPEFGCRDEFMDVIEVLTGTMRHDFPFPNTVDDALVLFYHLTGTLDSMFPAT